MGGASRHLRRRPTRPGWETRGLSFFEPPPPGPEPSRPPRRPWHGPPDSVAGRTVALDLAIGRSRQAALWIPYVTVYPDGFEFEVELRHRLELDEVMHPFFQHHPRRRPGAEGLDPELVRVGIELADGRRATSLGRPFPFAPGDPDVPPAEPVLSPRGGGGGGGGRWRNGFWFWPLPPEGPLAFVCEWPAAGVGLTRTEVDAALLREAAAGAETLWAEDEQAPAASSVGTRYSIMQAVGPVGRAPERSREDADELSAISRAFPDRIEVRGRDLATDLMGRVGFTDYFHLLLTGREPTDDERFFLDLLLVAIAEHGLVPSVVAARMTLAAEPAALQGAVAAGILGAGSVILGAAAECAGLLADAAARGAEAVVTGIHSAGGRVAGFGHPLHKPVDPRAERILALADERGVAGTHVAVARELREVVARVYGKPLTLNVSLPIAAVLLDLGYPPATAKAVPVLARTASLLAHLAEEQQRPIGFLLAERAAGA